MKYIYWSGQSDAEYLVIPATFLGTCHPIPVCSDGWSEHTFQATCRTDVDDFEDNWQFTGADSWAPEMCNCQMEKANEFYPIFGGGHYECNSEMTKRCFPKCPNGNTLYGSIFCDRTGGGGENPQGSKVAWKSDQAQSFKILNLR